ncbi:MAG TPA: methyltransferase domain-containing protein [Polyangiaceae bacterium]|nr:methyltransferase domain-containing protein [Polyangiaceae bacterium]
MGSRAPTAVEDVRRYYDENTARFVRFGDGRDIGAIHRAVRPEPGDSETDPLRTLDRLVLAELTRVGERFAPPLHVLDLGCGVGSSVVYLATARPIHATGVTLSGVQAARARERVEALGLDARVEILEASYLELPETLPPAALAFSLEAFIHGPDPAAFFASAAARVAPDGALVICDDFLGSRAERPLTPRDERFLRDVREGWLANSLVTVSRALELAGAAGFRLERNLDLSARLDLERPRDRAIAVLVALGRHLPLDGYWFRSLRGGHALQQALKRKLLEFRCLVWRRV